MSRYAEFFAERKQFLLQGFTKPFSDKRKGETGLTLIEIIIVVALLATLMAYIASNLTTQAENAKQDQSKIAMSKIQQSLEMYKIHVGTYPESLDALLNNPGDSKKWRGPYIEENKLRDPWDQEFQFQKEGRAFKITSPGSDGELGTADDIVFPEEGSQ
ncbi:MAG: type II secretion system protein GspG [Oligoflexales bacterium]|nr:type II secretion system protein GspG [Oligoflexales bacterium]